jgi:hypothetical protein
VCEAAILVYPEAQRGIPTLTRIDASSEKPAHDFAPVGDCRIAEPKLP